MIFDSPAMQKLLTKYSSRPDHAVPEVVYLGRSDSMASSREYLEDLVRTANLSDQKRQDWINRLLKEAYDQFKPAWFEIMLYGWLREVGDVVVSPPLEGNDPDFGVVTGGQQLVVEAYTLLETLEERAWQARVAELMNTLEAVQKPFWIHVEKFDTGGKLDTRYLQREVAHWLEIAPHAAFTYEDTQGNRLLLTVASAADFPHIGVIGPGQTEMVGNHPLKAPLRAKASQHRAIRSAGYPYVIAVLLDRWQLSAEDVAEAWLGKTMITWHDDSGASSEWVADQRSGLHVFGSEIRHTSVSGTLAFRAISNITLARNDLVGWYIENPYAKVRVDPRIFPVRASYVVVDKAEQSFSMGWRANDSL